MLEALDAPCNIIVSLLTKKEPLSADDKEHTRNAIIILVIIIFASACLFIFRRRLL
jgi:hypothetical protein